MKDEGSAAHPHIDQLPRNWRPCGGTRRRQTDQGKRVGLVGGDHSTPPGFFRAQAKRHDHRHPAPGRPPGPARKAYEGFTHSHASILYNALGPAPGGEGRVRGTATSAWRNSRWWIANRAACRCSTTPNCRPSGFAAATPGGPVRPHHRGPLPDKVHVTFDIDGLDPTLCPNTGTPVPGGPQLPQATFLLSPPAASGREGHRLRIRWEVSPGEDE